MNKMRYCKTEPDNLLKKLVKRTPGDTHTHTHHTPTHTSVLIYAQNLISIFYKLFSSISNELKITPYEYPISHKSTREKLQFGSDVTLLAPSHLISNRLTMISESHNAPHVVFCDVKPHASITDATDTNRHWYQQPGHTHHCCVTTPLVGFVTEVSSCSLDQK